ncbi:regulatory protein GemA [Breoghania sp.]|uniref:gp16 family protein n=1 Tax=Breoghania sp. TaxID=2065378 RepID=UPI0029CA6754|nr:regulatory protein GemA [Breoghania sp.]
MSAALKAIHAKKRQLGLDDDAYRAVLVRVTGLSSSKDMNEAQRRDVVAEMNRLGAPKVSRPRNDRASGTYAPKLQALWIAAHNLGVVRDRSDRAMISFVRRMTGIDHTRFLHDQADAMKAIEALKKWIQRETRSDFIFSQGRYRPALMNDHGFQVLSVQWARLVTLDATPAPMLTSWTRDRFGKADPCNLSDADWIDAMNELGVILRKAMARKEEAA